MNLTLYQTYVIRTAAFTNVGHGPFSDRLEFTMDPDTMINMILANPNGDLGLEELTSQTWFIAFIGSVLFVLVLMFILVIIYRRYRGPQKHLSPHQNVPLHHRLQDSCHYATTGDQTLWMQNSWQQAMEKQQFIQNKNYQPATDHPHETLYAEVGEASFGPRNNFTSFGGSGSYRSDPAPYATTTLAMNNKMRTLVSRHTSYLGRFKKKLTLKKFNEGVLLEEVVHWFISSYKKLFGKCHLS